jgi:hypothetical protein
MHVYQVELKKYHDLHAEFAKLVYPTQSHLLATNMGWKKRKTLSSIANLSRTNTKGVSKRQKRDGDMDTKIRRKENVR